MKQGLFVLLGLLVWGSLAQAQSITGYTDANFQTYWRTAHKEVLENELINAVRSNNATALRNIFKHDPSLVKKNIQIESYLPFFWAFKKEYWGVIDAYLDFGFDIWGPQTQYIVNYTMEGFKVPCSTHAKMAKTWPDKMTDDFHVADTVAQTLMSQNPTGFELVAHNCHYFNEWETVKMFVAQFKKKYPTLLVYRNYRNIELIQIMYQRWEGELGFDPFNNRPPFIPQSKWTHPANEFERAAFKKLCVTNWKTQEGLKEIIKVLGEVRQKLYKEAADEYLPNNEKAYHTMLNMINAQLTRVKANDRQAAERQESAEKAAKWKRFVDTFNGNTVLAKRFQTITDGLSPEVVTSVTYYPNGTTILFKDRFYGYSCSRKYTAPVVVVTTKERVLMKKTAMDRTPHVFKIVQVFNINGKRVLREGY